MPVSVIPVGLLLGAMAGACQQALSGRLREYVGSPSLESTRLLQALNRLAANCASLKHCTQPLLDAPAALLKPVPAASSGILQVVVPSQAGADVRRPWNQHQRLLQLGGVSPPAHEPSPATSVGTRPSGILHTVRHGAQSILGGAVGWLGQKRPLAVHQAGVEAPLLNTDCGVCLPTTAPIAIAGQHWSAPVAALGAVVAGGVFVTGANALYQYMKHSGPDLGLLDSERVFAQPPPHVQALLDELKNHWHLTPEGELTSTWDALMAMRAGPDTSAPRARVRALLHQDFGESLSRLPGLATPRLTPTSANSMPLKNPRQCVIGVPCRPRPGRARRRLRWSWPRRSSPCSIRQRPVRNSRISGCSKRSCVKC
ncbi:hypothetical protein [Pseudomonas sp. TH10]|uniref:hypothetical protein n=1 Tax=Pseudomonas sp. TH10 TaxID=2796376 RepID=UPI0019130A2F|nr:hypothetical protein [Pseudomonas sp. TH10]MBK5518947.1 hypothetical protein [Pseudomonas sp. TH10]